VVTLVAVVSFGVGVYGMATGTWWPFGAFVFDYWTLIAFPVWVALGVGVALLLGLQLTAMGVIGTEAVSHQPGRSVQELRAGAHPSVGKGEGVCPGLCQPVAAVIDARLEADAEEAEPVLAHSGR
jgi:hypothetical protein